VGTHSLEVHGNHSLEQVMQTPEFFDDPLKVQQPQTWHSSHSKPPSILSERLLKNLLKKSEHYGGNALFTCMYYFTSECS
jgi:hypothetical protein